MKKTYLAFLLVGAFMALPLAASAHMAGDFGRISGDVSAEEFETIGDTMLKMMNGETLAPEEAQEMYSFMSEHRGTPGAYGLLSGTYGGAFWPSGFRACGWGAMLHGWGGWITTGLVWILLGLGIAVLARKLIKNRS